MMATAIDDTLFCLVEALQRKAPEYCDLLSASSDDAYYTALAQLIQRVIGAMEADRKEMRSMNENGLSTILAIGITMPGLIAHRERNSNGHVDITIICDVSIPARHTLVEAKIYRGPTYHIKGVQQLLGRYSTGREGHGFLIVYVQCPGIARIFTRLRNVMDERKPIGQSGPTVPQPAKWVFASTHRHSSGEHIRVCHMGCNLFYEGRGNRNTNYAQ